MEGSCFSDGGFIFRWVGPPMGSISFDGVVLKKIVGRGGCPPTMGNPAVCNSGQHTYVTALFNFFFVLQDLIESILISRE